MSEQKMSVEEVNALILQLIQKRNPDITVNDEEFVDLLGHSLSLNTMEKKRVVDAASTLSQFQFDELKKVFVEERVKFKDLAKEHPEDIKKLLTKQQAEWLQLGDIYTLELQNQQKEAGDQAKVDDIKSQLGL